MLQINVRESTYLLTANGRNETVKNNSTRICRISRAVRPDKFILSFVFFIFFHPVRPRRCVVGFPPEESDFTGEKFSNLVQSSAFPRDHDQSFGGTLQLRGKSSSSFAERHRNARKKLIVRVFHGTRIGSCRHETIAPFSLQEFN